MEFAGRTNESLGPSSLDPFPLPTVHYPSTSPENLHLHLVFVLIPLTPSGRDDALPPLSLSLLPPFPFPMLHPLSSEIVEFPFRIPTQIGIVDDGLDDIPWVVRSFSSEGGGLEVTRRGNEGSDLNKQTRSKTSAFRSVSSGGWEMAIEWIGKHLRQSSRGRST